MKNNYINYYTSIFLFSILYTPKNITMSSPRTDDVFHYLRENHESRRLSSKLSDSKIADLAELLYCSITKWGIWEKISKEDFEKYLDEKRCHSILKKHPSYTVETYKYVIHMMHIIAYSGEERFKQTYISGRMKKIY